MHDPVVFLDANVLASPVTRTLLIAGARLDRLLVTWSAHVEAEADRHARGTATPTSVVRRDILGMELAATAASTDGLVTRSAEDRQVVADAAAAGARYLVTTDVDDFALEDLVAHDMSAVNPDHLMAAVFTERAYRAGVRTLAGIARRPPRSEADVHEMLGRRHPRLTERFADVYDIRPVDADVDQPTVVFRGRACLRCGASLDDEPARRLGLCPAHAPRPST